jgi:hypothetical protein
MKRIIRVFPRRTKATPTDELAAINRSPELFDQADEIHISVAFSYDLPRAEQLAKEWKYVAPPLIGGPATGQRSEDFIPGMYIKQGFTITSRGCPNRCWFCNVWKREGDTVRTLPIRDGWNILDDNLLACPEEHIRAVFAMLARQPERIQFTGGLEAKRLKEWHAKELRKLHPKQMFFAYDTEDDLEPLQQAGKILLGAGFTTTSHALRCYVLVGWPKDTQEQAEKRMRQTMTAGFTPMAMLYRNQQGTRSLEWMRWAKKWARPAIIHTATSTGTSSGN